MSVTHARWLDAVVSRAIENVGDGGGPFAALEGVGAGQLKPGEVRSCDHVHGANTIGF